MKKKMLAMLLACSMMATMAPVAFAEEGNDVNPTSAIASEAEFIPMSQEVYDIQDNFGDWADAPAAVSDFGELDYIASGTAVNVSGVAKHVKGFTGWNVAAEENGYYAAFQVAAPDDVATGDTVIAVLNPNNSDKKKEYKASNLDTDTNDSKKYVDVLLFLGADEAAVQAKEWEIQFDWDGDGTKYDAQTYTLRFADVSAPLVSGAALTGNGFTASGTFDAQRKATLTGDIALGVYEVAADNDARTDFTDVLTNHKPNGDFAIAKIAFAGLHDDADYTVRQTNEGMNAAYGAGTFTNDVKVKSYTGAALKAGLNFVVAKGKTPITFEVQEQGDTADTWTDSAYTDTFTIANDVSFTIPAFSAKIDNRGFGKITATEFEAVAGEENTFACEVTGNVDMRTYAVTDATLQADFDSLLDTARTRSAVDPKYVKAGFNLVFADIDFKGIDGNKLVVGGSQYYNIKQINPGMAYAYPGDAKIGDGIKEGHGAVSQELSDDGMTFILADHTKTQEIASAGVKADDIVIEISNCNADGSNKTNTTTFIIHNKVTFGESPAPADTVVEVAPSVDSTQKTATAEVPTADIGNKVDAAADTAEQTLTIDATSVTSEVTTMVLTIDKSIVNALAANDQVSAAVKTPVGDVVLPPEAIGKINEAIGSDSYDAVLTVKETTASVAGATIETAFAVEVQVNSSPVPMNGLQKPITLSFYIGTGRTDNPVLVYVNGGTIEAITSSHYDPATGILSGTTAHLSTFGVKIISEMTATAADGGIGKKVTLGATANNYVTVQVTSNGANALYTVQVPVGASSIEIYVPNGSTLTAWETTSAPVFTAGEISDATVVATVTKTF